MSRTLNRRGKGGVLITHGFDEMLEEIKKAGGNIEEATWDAVRKGGKVFYDQLVSEIRATGTSEHLIDGIAFQAERDASRNRFGCKVGWRMPEYNPDNPSIGHKAVFINYGTPRRYSSRGDRGYITGRGFIGRAKRKARPKIKDAQKEALEKILKGLQ